MAKLVKKGNNRKRRKMSAGNKSLLIAGLIIIVVSAFVIIATIMETKDRKTAKVEQYKGIYVNVTPTEDAIDAEEEAFSDENLSKKKGRVVKKNDYISIDFEGTINGKSFDGGSGKDITLTVGDYDYLEDMENALIGKKVGDTFNIKVKFPEDYDEDLVGKTAIFKTTINGIQIPYSDELVKEVSNGKYTTTKDYRAVLAEKVKKDNIEDIAEQAWEKVVKKATLKQYDDALAQEAIDDIERENQSFAEVSNMTYEEFLDEYGMSEDDIISLGKDLMKEWLVAETILKKEDVVMSDEMYREELVKNLQDGDTTAQNEDGKAYSDMKLDELILQYQEGGSEHPKEDMQVQLAKSIVGKYAVTTK